MILLQVIIPQRYNYRHCGLERVHHGLQLVRDRVGRKIFLNTEAYFRELIGLRLNLLRVDVAELLLNPGIGLLLPLVEGAPHQAPQVELVSKIVQITELSSWHLQDLLVLVVFEGCLF